jgi:hypothetical protein
MGIEKILIVAAVITYFIADTFTTIIGVFLGGIESNNMYAMLDGGSLMGIILLKLGLTILLVGTATLLMFTRLRNEGISALIAIFVGGVLATLNNIVTIFTGFSLFYGWMGLSILEGQYLILLIMLVVALVSLIIINIITPRRKVDKKGAMLNRSSLMTQFIPDNIERK